MMQVWKLQREIDLNETSVKKHGIFKFAKLWGQWSFADTFLSLTNQQQPKLLSSEPTKQAFFVKVSTDCTLAKIIHKLRNAHGING